MYMYQVNCSSTLKLEMLAACEILQIADCALQNPTTFQSFHGLNSLMNNVVLNYTTYYCQQKGIADEMVLTSRPISS